MSKDSDKNKAVDWKIKARQRSKECNRLKKRVEELRISRDKWQNKYKDIKSMCTHHANNMGIESKPRGHQYSLWILMLVLDLNRYGGMSLRSCKHCVRCLSDQMGLCLRVPSHVSIRNWLLKQGYYMYKQRKAVEALGGQWAVIADESIMVGTQRLLVVLGLNLSTWKFDRPISLEDVSVLHIEMRAEWKGKEVKRALELATAGLEVIQGVSDSGRNLLNSFDLWGVDHFADCSHKIANILKKHLKKNDLFVRLCKESSVLRQCWNIGKYTAWIPPKPRGKSRFMNVFPLVDWTAKMLKEEIKLPEEVRQKTAWLFDNRSFYQILQTLHHTISQVLVILKSQGVQTTSIQEAKKFLSQSDDPLTQFIYKDLQVYLEELLEKIKEKNEPRICCSDIIETLFGKFKYRLKNAGTFTDFALIIPFFCGKITQQMVKMAFSFATLEQVKNWNKAA